ncbi:MAG: glycoside hydrolase family 125 protein [Armatimonadota bacterium]|nr:glycoside hydrolase family 125 protein [Armatimonadota bacterium]
MPNINPTRLSTGNELISIPDISTKRCGIETISFLHRGLRASVEISGDRDLPFLQPVVSVDGIPTNLEKAVWRQDENWLPAFHLTEQKYELQGHIFAPLQSRGLVYTLQIESKSTSAVSARIGWQGCWSQTCHATYTAKPMIGVRRAAINQWLGMPFVEFQSVAPHFAVAFRPSEVMEVQLFTDSGGGTEIRSVEHEITAEPGTAAGYSLTREFKLKPGEQIMLAIYVGIGPEEISAVSSAADLSRRGHEDLLNTTIDWLRRHSLRTGDNELECILNLNQFYNYFFSQGVTLDTEEQILVTSRSSTYPLTACYCDRDAMLWSLPAVLSIEPQQARRMLEYAFTVQMKNVGIHSRFIDGVVLEPGFELDELVAPIHALSRYVQATSDMSMLFDRRIQVGVNHILEILSLKKHPVVPLYETTLLPSDDVATYPYVTYDNAMVWRMLRDMSRIYERIGDLDRRDDTAEHAARVKRAIMEHAIVEGPFGEMFVWSVDLQGRHRLYDNPQGSLQLLPYLDFCDSDLEQYKNTVRWIHSEENPLNTPQMTDGPKRISLFSVANDLLMGRTEKALEFLKRAPLDEGICCEIADAETGAPVSGRGYAACAGFVAYAMAVALNASMEKYEEQVRITAPQYRLGGKQA